MRTLRPWGDRVLVRRVEAATKTAGGLYVPETAAAAERPTVGVVVAVGPTVGVDVAPGTEVYYAKYSGVEVKLEGETLVLLRAEEVLGDVVEEAGGK